MPKVPLFMRDYQDDSNDFYNRTKCLIQLMMEAKLKRHDLQRAFFVERPSYEQLKKAVKRFEIVITDKLSWDYDLEIHDSQLNMKLFWLPGLPVKQTINMRRYYRPDIFDLHNSMDPKYLFKNKLKVLPAFQFLQPDYLKYMEKPFNNRHVYTQVNLILDYHRQQKKRRGVEVFNIADLIAFKMAIDDNRLAYENCEFHKLIDGHLKEATKNPIFTTSEGKEFHLQEYLCQQQVFFMDDESFEYLAYHFQNTLKAVYFKNETHSPINLKDMKLGSITPLLKCLENRACELYYEESELTGELFKVLYEIMSKVKNDLQFSFSLDREILKLKQFTLSSNYRLSLPSRHIQIANQNNTHFIDNFINWLKQSFRKKCSDFAITLVYCGPIQPYTFSGFHVDVLEFVAIELNWKLMQALLISNHKNIRFFYCTLANDEKERIEFVGHRKENDQNIFKLLDCLENVEVIYLNREEHTMGTLWKYVTYAMHEQNLTEFRFKNRIDFHDYWAFKDKTFIWNKASETIEIFSTEKKSGKMELIPCNDVYGADRELDRNEFDFYQ